MSFTICYCDGYYFLESLGLKYGLRIIATSGYKYSWKELSNEAQSKLIDLLVPGAIDEAHKVLSWLESDKIFITSKLNELGHYLYLDKRTEEEKQTV